MQIGENGYHSVVSGVFESPEWNGRLLSDEMQMYGSEIRRNKSFNGIRSVLWAEEVLRYQWRG